MTRLLSRSDPNSTVVMSILILTAMCRSMGIEGAIAIAHARLWLIGVEGISSEGKSRDEAERS